MANRLIRQSNFVSFDGTVSTTTAHQRPDRYRHMESIEKQMPRIARGGGYSYSAASFRENTLVQEMILFNRLLEFDPHQLTIKVESGVRLGDLLTWAIKRKLYFPVIPGYPLITIGGCVAADVHGKNPYRDGTFSDWVKELTVFHPESGYHVISPTVSTELFSSTCGGFGLTGIITDVTLQLVQLPANHVVTSRRLIQSLGAAVESISCSEDDFCYSWHDGSPGAQFGRGIVFSGRWGRNESSDIVLPTRYMTAESRGRLPFSLWNAVTARIANSAFFLRSKFDARSSEQNVLAVSFPFVFNTFYHKSFGRPGFREAQILISKERIATFLDSLEKLVAATKPPTIMISLKQFRGQQKSLSMTGMGYLVAVDCFQNSGTTKFFDQLDELTISDKGQPNLTKDSRLPRDVAESSIRHYHEFSGFLSKYDTSRLFRSELSARIGL